MVEKSAEATSPLPKKSEATAIEEITVHADTVWTHGEGKAPGLPKVSKRKLKGVGGRVAIVDGCRTPFSKAMTSLRNMDVTDLASLAAGELVTRNSLDPNDIDLSIFGVVVPSLMAPNLGREVLFRCSLPMHIPGTTVSLACASANRALTSGAEAILTGQADMVLTGGSESLTNVPIQYSKNAADRLREFAKAKSLPKKLQVVSKLRPKDLVPIPPAIAEYTTGMSMGQAAEKMAKENGISRRSQDEIALMSHHRAAAAWDAGYFDRQVVTAFPPPRYNHPVERDNGVRPDTTMEALEGLRPVFDKRYGSLSAGNSSPLTDGGGAVLISSEKRAEQLGLAPLGYVRSWAYWAVDPGEQLLQGPAYAAPLALERAGLQLKDMGLIEMHEAFAAQILSNVKAFASAKFAREELGRAKALGVVDYDKFNVNGGSIALGHPFGATGARVTTQLLYEMNRRDVEFGLMTVCAAGGVGFAMVVERG